MGFGGYTTFKTFEDFLEYIEGERKDPLQATTPDTFGTRYGRYTMFELYDNNMWNEVISIQEDCVDKIKEWAK